MSTTSPQQRLYLKLITTTFQQLGIGIPTDDNAKTHTLDLPDGKSIDLDHYPENWLTLSHSLDFPEELNTQILLEFLNCNMNFTDRPTILFGAKPQKRIFVIWTTIELSKSDTVQLSSLIERFIITIHTVKDWIHSTPSTQQRLKKTHPDTQPGAAQAYKKIAHPLENHKDK